MSDSVHVVAQDAHGQLAADDQDTAWDFAASSEAHGVTYVSDPFTVTRRYCSGGSVSFDDCPGLEEAALRTDLTDDWNQGGLIVQFTGHSSWQQWAAERYFRMDDLAALRNDRRLPVVAEMTRFTGTFQRPEPTLDDSLVTLAGAGAALGLTPTPSEEAPTDTPVPEPTATSTPDRGPTDTPELGATSTSGPPAEQQPTPTPASAPLPETGGQTDLILLILTGLGALLLVGSLVAARTMRQPEVAP